MRSFPHFGTLRICGLPVPRLHLGPMARRRTRLGLLLEILEMRSRYFAAVMRLRRQPVQIGVVMTDVMFIEKQSPIAGHASLALTQTPYANFPANSRFACTDRRGTLIT
jgi:hypothetical protein